jgi:uncharacterized delta-60 repeat protein
LDSSFGGNGQVMSQLGSFSHANAVAIQSDGKIVVAGSSDTSSYFFSRQIAVARYNANGTLDASFSGDGFVTTTVANTFEEAYAVAVQSDGKIVVAGYSAGYGIGYNGNHVAVVRYNADGSLDDTFGNAGGVIADFDAAGSLSVAYGLALQSDGKIVVAGDSRVGYNDSFGVARYNVDGTSDTTFDGDGVVTTAFPGGYSAASSVAIQSDNRIAVGGYSCPDYCQFAVARYDTNGSLDVSFDGDGMATTAVAGVDMGINSIALQSDGKVVAGGWSCPYYCDFGLARYDTDGTLDTTFGGGGIVTTHFPGKTDSWLTSIQVQSDGKVVAAGTTYDFNRTTTFNDFALVRYQGDNVPPVADAGGPYQIVEGGSLTLNATASSDENGDSLTYSWDVNGDGIFGDATGVAPTLSWSSLIGLGINDNGTRNVTVRVSDGKGGVDDATTILTIQNAAPVAGISGPSDGVRGQPRKFTFNAIDPSPVDQAAGFSFAINWGDGATQVVSSLSGLKFQHIYTTQGSYVIQMTAMDKDGGASAPISHSITIAIAGTQVDPGDATKSALAVGGSLGNDKILIRPGTNAGDVVVTLNGDVLGTFHPTGRIMVYAQAGDDDIQLAGAITLPTLLDGGDGNDRVKGDSGPNVELGGSGDDLLVGGSNRDVLIGGVGADKIVGNEQDDVLIAGSTAFDANEAALLAIQSEWTSAADYDRRIAHLRNTASGGQNGSIFLIVNDTVFNDASLDVLTGDTGRDWFFANLAGSGVKDKITDLSANELAQDLDFIQGT